MQHHPFSSIFSNTTPCFNFLEFSSATNFSVSPISSQFQQLSSCCPGSRRRRRTTGSSSPYPVEGGKRYLWLKSFYLCSGWFWISSRWLHNFRVEEICINIFIFSSAAAVLWPLMILLDKEKHNSDADKIIVWALPTGLVTTIFPNCLFTIFAAAHILWILGNFHI